MEDAAAKADERDDEEKLQRVDEVVGDLRGNDVEPEEAGYGEAEDGSGAEDGVDADEEASGETPGELLRGCSTAEEREDRQSDAAVDPAVMGRRCVRGCFS